MRRVLLGSYSLLWKAARPLVARHKRLREDFSLRLVPDAWKPPFPVAIWIQAASGGESFLVRQLLEALAAEQAAEDCSAPGCSAPRQPLRILCTSCTRQGLDVLRAARDFGETLTASGAKTWPHLELAVQVFPLDAPELMRRALTLASPRAAIVLETELWPGFLAACAQASVPVLTLNGRMTEKSLRGYSLLRSFWQSVAPWKILAMAEADGARFAALFGADRVRIVPNIKFDAVPMPERAPQVNPAHDPAFTLLPEGVPVILLASVREEEEALLLPVLDFLHTNAPHAAIVIAPRHMERADAWHTQLATRFGPDSVLRYSTLMQGQPGDLGQPGGPGTFVLWDVFGQLLSLYARCEAVFVGGSLAPLGGQNYLEAAGQGRVPVIGPYWKNFSWIGEDFFAAGLGKQVAGAAELGPALLEILAHTPPPEAVRQRLEGYIAPRRGGVAASVQAVLALLAVAGQPEDTE